MTHSSIKKLLSAVLTLTVLLSTLVFCNATNITVYADATRYEVEGPALLGHTDYEVEVYGTQQQNPQYGPFERNSTASGGYVTTYLQQYSVQFEQLNPTFSNQSHVQFKIPFDKAGQVDIVVGYISTDPEFIAIKANADPAIKVEAPSSTRQTEKVTINVIEGINTIYVSGRLQPHRNWLNMDYIDISERVATDGVSLDQSEMTLTTGKSKMLTAAVTPPNASEKTVTFASDNPCVQVQAVTLDALTGKTSAVIKGVSEGSATITATALDGGSTAQCTVHVEPDFSPVYYDGQENVIDDLTATVLRVKTPYKNTNTTDATLTMFVAVYAPNGVLTAVTTDVLAFEPHQIRTFDATLALPENDSGRYAEEGYYAKVFLWKEFVPVVPAWKFPKEPPLINPNPTTFCNPINVSYQYQSETHSSRESADPAIVTFKGDYFLFSSKSSGYWWSEDLINWEFVYCVDAEMNKWAPAALEIGEYLYLTHSEGGAMFRSNNPKDGGSWTYVRDNGWGDGDPALFKDDDGKVYAYFGLSGDNKPLWGVELDPNNNMARVGEVYELFYPNPAAHGFEVPGEFNTNYNSNPWMEGAWMNKHNGKYYFMYAVPGTEVASYANGCYIGDGPLGPFEFCENSPISYKATGFMVGAGHGSLFQDHIGNWWKFDTASISVNTMFERRLLMYPAAFDQDGQLVTNTVFADYPIYIPFGGKYSYETPRPDWNLLSYNKLTQCSSIAGGSYTASKAVDESMRTWWSAATGNAGEWLSVDLGEACDVNAFQINFADQDTVRVSTGRNNTYRYQYLAEYSLDGENWFTLVDNSANVGEPYRAQDVSHDYFELTKATSMKYIRVINCGGVPAGGKFAISGLRVFGHAGGTAPDEVSSFTVSRPATSPSTERTAVVNWSAVPGAEGYIVRFGVKPDSLNIHYQVIGGTSATINCLNMGVGYYFTVDSYNASGYTPGKTRQYAEWTLTPPPSTVVKPPLVLKDPATIEGYTVYGVSGANSMTRSTNVTLGSNSNAPVGTGNNIFENMHNANAWCQAVNMNGGSVGGNGFLRMCYSRGETNSTRITVQINSGTAVEWSLPPTGSWNTFKAVEIPITGIVAGTNNTIRITGGDSGFNVNYIQLIY